MPRSVTPVGEHMANLRRKDGLGKNPQRAATRAAQLAAIGPDWNCPWPLDWQRHYRVLAELAADEPGGHLPDIAPGVLYEGDDLGKWLQRQRRSWAELSKEQQQRLTALGVTPAEPPAWPRRPRAPGRHQPSNAAWQPSPSTSSARAPTKQYQEDTSNASSSTARSISTSCVWISNTKTRRDKLTEEQLDALRELGIQWA
jgi:hypothetical protein